MVDAGAAYAEVQGRMSAAVARLSSEQLATRVPACPEWTVHDLVAHHAAVISELAAGKLAELGDLVRLLDQNADARVASDRDAMTARQVVERRDRAISTILEEWAEATHRVTPMLQGSTPFPARVGPMGVAIAVNDVVVHEGDLHQALGMEQPAVVYATSLALAGYGFSLDYRIRRTRLPALAFEYDGKQRIFGDDGPDSRTEVARRSDALSPDHPGVRTRPARRASVMGLIGVA